MRAKELTDIVKAWLAISLMFAIAMAGLSFSINFILILGLAAATAGVGFIAHELAHKLVSQKLGTRAEFQSFDTMLIIGILLAFTGFIFAAPGAVMIYGRPSRENNGKISAAGIAASLLVALFFLVIYIFSFNSVFQSVGFYGAYINAWIGIFNLIPFGNFDGRKVLAWSKPVYFALLAGGLVLLFSNSNSWL